MIDLYNIDIWLNPYMGIAGNSSYVSNFRNFSNFSNAWKECKRTLLISLSLTSIFTCALVFVVVKCMRAHELRDLYVYACACVCVCAAGGGGVKFEGRSSSIASSSSSPSLSMHHLFFFPPCMYDVHGLLRLLDSWQEYERLLLLSGCCSRASSAEDACNAATFRVLLLENWLISRNFL